MGASDPHVILPVPVPAEFIILDQNVLKMIPFHSFDSFYCRMTLAFIPRETMLFHGPTAWVFAKFWLSQPVQPGQMPCLGGTSGKRQDKWESLALTKHPQAAADLNINLLGLENTSCTQVPGNLAEVCELLPATGALSQPRIRHVSTSGVLDSLGWGSGIRDPNTNIRKPDSTSY